MANRTVTLTATTWGSDISTVDIYGTSVLPSNLITSSITSASLAAGFTFTASETHYTFQLTTDAMCATTHSIALTGAPIESWTSLGTSGSSGESIVLIGGEVITSSLGGIVYDGDSTWMVVPEEYTGWVLTSVDNGDSWLKEEEDDAPFGNVHNIDGCFFGTTTATDGGMSYSADDGNTFTQDNIDKVGSLWYDSSETFQVMIGTPSQWRNCFHMTTITSSNSYYHSYDGPSHGPWSGTISRPWMSSGFGPLNGIVTGECANMQYLTGHVYNPPSTFTRSQIESRRKSHTEAMGGKHSWGIMNNITGSCQSGSYNLTRVIVGLENGNMTMFCQGGSAAGACRIASTDISSGESNTNFDVVAVAGNTGSAANPYYQWLAAVDHSNGYAGEFVSSSDGGTTWAQYTATGMGDGDIVQMVHDGTKYIAAGYSGSNGVIWQSRGNRLDLDWRMITSSNHFNSVHYDYTTGYYFAVGDSGSMYRGQ